MPQDVDNSDEFNPKSVQLYESIHEYHDAGYSNRAIALRLHCSRNTITRYLNGDFKSLCKKDLTSGISQFHAFIVKELTAGVCRKDIIRHLLDKGYQGKQTAAYDYMNAIIKREHIEIAVYRSSSTEIIQKRKALQKYECITRTEIMNLLWDNLDFPISIHDYIMEHYPVIRILRNCIREFREIYEKKSMPLLYLFINRYMSSDLVILSRFAKGLQKDIEAVENSVASPMSNGFVEGTNSKLKMVKRTMYGRCGYKLLSAKLLYRH